MLTASLAKPGCAAVTVKQVRRSVDRIIAEEAAIKQCSSFTVIDIPPEIAAMKLGAKDKALQAAI